MNSDAERGQQLTVEQREPTAVFSLLGDGIRLDILQALGKTPDQAVTFADLHRRSGVRDSGQFNYHLGKLRGTFIRRTDEGYRLTHAGRQVVGAIHAGTYTASATLDPLPVDGACLQCGGEVVATYADETALVACTDCEGWRNELPFPPGSLDQFEPAELPGAFDRWMQQVFRGTVAGFCAICAGRTSGRLVLDDRDDDDQPPHVEFECARCGSASRASAPLPALFHPAVQGFLYDQGIELDREPTWQLQALLVPDVTVESTDPPRVTIRFGGDGKSLRVGMEADATIGDIERVAQ